MLRRLEERAHAEYARSTRPRAAGLSKSVLEGRCPSTTRRTRSSGRRSASRARGGGRDPRAHLLARTTRSSRGVDGDRV